MPDQDLFLERGDATDAGSDEHSTSKRVGGQGAGLFECHVRCSYGELGAPVAATYRLRVLEVGGRIEVVDPSVTLRGISAEAVPEGVGADATGGDYAHPRDSDPTAGHQSLPTTRS